MYYEQLTRPRAIYVITQSKTKHVGKYGPILHEHAACVHSTCTQYITEVYTRAVIYHRNDLRDRSPAIKLHPPSGRSLIRNK